MIIQIPSIYCLGQLGETRTKEAAGLRPRRHPKDEERGATACPTLFSRAEPTFGFGDTQGDSKDLSGMGSVHAVGDTGMGLKTVSFPPFSVLPLG